jgi:single-strand DNA-binding protein
MKKGSQVMVEGRMQTRSWDDQATNTKKYRTEIIADRVQFGTNTGGGSRTGDSTDKPTSNGAEDKDDGGLDTIEYPDEQINVDDIPF